MLLDLSLSHLVLNTYGFFDIALTFIIFKNLLYHLGGGFTLYFFEVLFG